jgi:hypothetical protein
MWIGDDMRTWLHWMMLAALLVCPAVLVMMSIREFLAVDSALDAGASFDYLAGRPDFSENHAFLSPSQRHSLLFAVSGVSFLAALSFATYAARKHRSIRFSQPRPADAARGGWA